ncbi:MAG: N-acetyl-gamma-glutamyl-phosphate reductase [Elusimicrobia bacterium]|nr:N-acetyl-gamma-glutamyl-phosphate reductase [Elusimicrobiota bacterium]
MIRVSILGATGYSGGELIHILLKDSSISLQHLTSESSAGQPIHHVHPELRGRLPHSFVKLNIKQIAKDSDVVFSCYPAAAGIKPNSQLVKAGVKVIDLSGDFRLSSAAEYKKWYKETHTAPALLKSAVYGLPELFREQIRQASLVANPGCYATAAVLSAAPLVKPLLVDPKSLIVDAKSGVSGAGKKLSSEYLYCEVDSNLKAYNVARHRHQPEIETVLHRLSRVSLALTFSPHLIPMPRGILSVLYATLKKSMKTEDIRSQFVRFYEREPFIRILPEGELPETKNVVHSNYCDIGITQDARTNRVIVLAALDNLVKGAAGQAVQNMNLCFKRPETEGLL